VRVFNRSTIRRYAIGHADARVKLWAWFREVERADWTGPDDVKRRYRSVDFLPGNRIVFNIKGNDYRMVVMVSYRGHCVFIRFIGTHAEYSKIDALHV
jgi:mRNA interferase HigB